MEALFKLQADGRWYPQHHTRGPFDGLQGGALSALMCAAAEAELPDKMNVVTIGAQFLRPCPLEPIDVVVRPIQIGSRLAVMHAELSAGGKLRATATVTAMTAITIDGLPALAPQPHRPWQGIRRDAPPVHGKPWLMNVMEARVDLDGVPWFKFEQAVTGFESAFARALCPADWIPGITRADSWEKPLVAGAPNVDLNVRAFRAPTGPWIGVKATAQWTPAGLGVAHGELIDVEGAFGTVACTVALIQRR